MSPWPGSSSPTRRRPACHTSCYRCSWRPWRWPCCGSSPTPNGFEGRAFATRLALSGALALGLCAAKLMAIHAFLGSYPRDFYPLAGVASAVDLLALLGRALFLDVTGMAPGRAVVNTAVHIAPVAFEFRVGIVPALLLPGAALAWGAARIRSRESASPPGAVGRADRARARARPAPRPQLLGAELEPAAEEPARRREQHPAPALILGVHPGLTVALFAVADRTYYERQSYEPRLILTAFDDARSGKTSPSIQRVAISRDAQGGEAMSFYGNTMLVRGETQLLCYETLFGFRLESLPRGQTREGEVFGRAPHFVNIKDPSCYLFPAENGCRPGDHLGPGRRADAVRFTSYRGLSFRMPLRQRLANALSLVSLAGVLLFLAASGLRRITQRIGRARPRVQARGGAALFA